jgi:hypothetical protein
MKRIKIGKALIFFGLIMYVIQNTIFGWNKLPMSESEEITDIITKILFYGGFIIYLNPVLDLYEDAVSKLKQNKLKNVSDGGK